MAGQEEMPSGCARVGLDWILGKLCSPQGLLSSERVVNQVDGGASIPKRI